jgi:hypothetical protein
LEVVVGVIVGFFEEAEVFVVVFDVALESVRLSEEKGRRAVRERRNGKENG